MNAVNERRLCEVCGEGALHPVLTSQNVEYKGVSATLPVQLSKCDGCESEIADGRQLLENKRAVIRFKKAIDGVPLGNEIAAMRHSHGLTQVVASELFGGGPVAFSKYENDDLLPSEAMANLLYLAIRFPDTVKRLVGRKGIALRQSYGCIEQSGPMAESKFYVESNDFVEIIETTNYVGADRRRGESKKEMTQSLSYGSTRENLWKSLSQ